MNHSEAMEQMAVERYLLEELGPDARDEFEEHMFECPDCAMDVRAGVVFIDEAKRQLPKLAAKQVVCEAPAVREVVRKEKPSRDWFAWLKPVVLAPACAVLLGVVAYQNLIMLPGLRQAADTPRIVSVTPLHGATRGSERQKLTTTSALGVTIPVDFLPADGASYGSFAVELLNPQGKVAWSATVPAPQPGEPAQKALSIPGRILQNGTYTVNISGLNAQGARTPVESYVFDLELRK